LNKIDERINKIKKEAEAGASISPDDVLFLVEMIEHYKGRKAPDGNV
jgi:hypothetical protein